MVILALGNLRGVRESGRIFALPTYFFIVSILVMVGVGTWKAIAGTTQPLPLPSDPVHSVDASVTLLLLLTAFSNGCTAMTGVEAVSNGVPAFKPPEPRNAAATLVAMAGISIVMFLGITLLHYGAVASQLTLTGADRSETPRHNAVLVPVSGMQRAVVRALDYAKTLSPDVRAVYVDVDPAATEQLRREWDAWGRGVPLVILSSPFRSLLGPLLEFIEKADASRADGYVTMCFPSSFRGVTLRGGGGGEGVRRAGSAKRTRRVNARSVGRRVGT